MNVLSLLVGLSMHFSMLPSSSFMPTIVDVLVVAEAPILFMTVIFFFDSFVLALFSLLLMNLFPGEKEELFSIVFSSKVFLVNH